MGSCTGGAEPSDERPGSVPESACAAAGCGMTDMDGSRGLSVLLGRIGVAKPLGVRVMGRGPVQVEVACGAALVELGGAFAASAVCGSAEEWAAAAGGGAAGDRWWRRRCRWRGIARLAAIEPEFLEDGTVLQSHRALGHVALDAPAVLSGVLSASAVHAQRRVRDRGAPWPVTAPAGSATATGRRVARGDGGGAVGRLPGRGWSPRSSSTPPYWWRPPWSPPWSRTSGPRTAPRCGAGAGGC